MTAKILSFDAARKSKQPIEKPVVETPKTNQEIFEEIYEFIIDEWQAHAVKNGLSEYIANKIPPKARGPKNADYVGDLNIISMVERKLDMKVSLHLYPDGDVENPGNWIVGFLLNKEVYLAPPYMVSESYARALNVLLYVGLTSQLKKLKRL